MGLSSLNRSLLSERDLLLLCLRLCSLLLLSSSRLLLFLSSSSELESSLGPSSGSPAPSLLGLLSSLLLRWLPWLSLLSLLGLRSWRRRSSLLSSLDPDLLGVRLRFSLEPDLLGVRLRSFLEPDLFGVRRRFDRVEVARLALLFLPSHSSDLREYACEPGQFLLVGPWFVGLPRCSDLGVLDGSLPQSVCPSPRMLMLDDVLSLRSRFLESCGGDLCLAGVSLSFLGLFPLCTESSLGGGVGALSSSSS